MTLALRVVARHVTANAVRILIDRDATTKARQSAFQDCVVGEFDSSFSLYRVLDGEELVRVLRSGKFSGGIFSVPAERAFGASWGSNISEVIQIGNEQLRGKRYGDDLFLAKLDAIGHRFFHLDPKAIFDPNGPAVQEATIDSRVFNFQLGAALTAELHDVDLFVVHPSHQIQAITIADAKEYVSKRPVKDVDLRAVHGTLFAGTIFGVDVRVHQDGKFWVVLLNDGKKIVADAPTKDDAIETAKIGIKMRPSNPVPTSFQLLQQKRRQEKHFELDDDPDKVRGSFALKPHDSLVVTKGSPELGIGARAILTVADVWQRKDDRRSVAVKFVVKGRRVTLWANHSNRLHDDEFKLSDSAGRNIVVRKR